MLSQPPKAQDLAQESFSDTYQKIIQQRIQIITIQTTSPLDGIPDLPPAIDKDDLSDKDAADKFLDETELLIAIKHFDLYVPPAYLEDDTLYLHFDPNKKSICVYSVGLQSTKHHIIESDKAWSWELKQTDVENITKLLDAEDPSILKRTFFRVLNPLLVDQLTQACGCNQVPEKSAEAKFKNTFQPAQLDQVINNISSRLIEKLSSDKSRLLDKSFEKKLGQFLKDINQTLELCDAAYDLVLMYYFLEKYLMLSKETLTMTNCPLLLAASSLLVLKTLNEHHYYASNIAKIFSVSKEELVKKRNDFFDVVIGMEKDFDDDQSPYPIPPRAFKTVVYPKTKTDFSIPSEKKNSNAVIDYDVYDRLKKELEQSPTPVKKPSSPYLFLNFTTPYPPDSPTSPKKSLKDSSLTPLRSVSMFVNTELQLIDSPLNNKKLNSPSAS